MVSSSSALKASAARTHVELSPVTIVCTRRENLLAQIVVAVVPVLVIDADTSTTISGGEAGGRGAVAVVAAGGRGAATAVRSRDALDRRGRAVSPDVDGHLDERV